jgi:hypothetical protein
MSPVKNTKTVHLLVNYCKLACNKFSVMGWCNSMREAGVTHFSRLVKKKKRAPEYM